MEWKDLAGKITELAPVLGGAVGGPAGAAVGLAISALARVFGLKSDVKPEEIEKAIQQDPQAFLKLRMAEMDFQLSLGQQKLNETEAYLKDVQSARQKEVDVSKTTGTKDVNLYMLAWVIVIGFFGLVSLLVFHDLPKDQNGVVFMLFGALSAGFGSVIGYFFGSSKGSSDKTKLLVEK